jgi:hypothetical protein
MTTNALAAALALSDDDLLARIEEFACAERGSCVALVAHLAALELRPSAHAARGYGSLFAYCTDALHLSEDAACNRIQAARACRSFPVILDLLASGSVTLSAIRMLGPHLTPENHESVLARVSYRRRDDILALVAELAPRPDVAASVRKLPVATPIDEGDFAMKPAAPTFPLLEDRLAGEAEIDVPTGASDPGPRCGVPLASPSGSFGSRAPDFRHRPVVQPLSPQRYRVQFTVGQESYDRLRRMQALLRREIPTGDTGLIFEQALALLAEKVERAKIGTAARPRSRRAIRPGADKAGSRTSRSRHIPNEVKRAVWWRDRGQCAFVSSAGHRCTERNYLELHHIQPYAMDGPATVGNISLRCQRHNQFEAKLEFGRYGPNRAEHSS